MATRHHTTIEQLRARHARLEERIAEFDQRPWLSDHEQQERKRLQKLKLAIKDRIAALLLDA